MASAGELWKRFRAAAFAPVDIASTVFFRIVFGALLFWHVCRYFVRGNVFAFWIEPRFMFKFYGFSWVQPWPNQWLYVHWALLGLFALLVAFGLCYRLGAALLFLSYSYFFLLDQARYVNHSYLACLFSFLLALTPAHRAFSLDASLRPALRSSTLPAWHLWLLRLQMGVVYFFAGLAKVSPDWLRGEPMRIRLASPRNFPLLGDFFRLEWAVYAASYGSMLFDLLIVPLLLWRRTRVPAFCAVLVFHLLNSLSFPLEFFPWLAIAGTAMFFRPDWPRRIWRRFNQQSTAPVSRRAARRVARRRATPAPAPAPAPLSPKRQGWVLGFVVLYAAIQLLLPLRAFCTPGGLEWNYAEHPFSWRMLLVSQRSRGAFYVNDPNNGETRQVDLAQFLGPRQRSVLTSIPDFAWQSAHYLAATMPRSGPQPLRVAARLFVSINGRQPVPYLNPEIDLAAAPRPFFRPAWLNRIDEPLPPLPERYRLGTGFNGVQ